MPILKVIIKVVIFNIFPHLTEAPWGSLCYLIYEIIKLNKGQILEALNLKSRDKNLISSANDHFMLDTVERY